MVQDIFDATPCMQGAHEKPGNIFFFFRVAKDVRFFKMHGREQSKRHENAKKFQFF